MVVFPFAKVNLGLEVLRIRPDGYRDIATVMYPIPLFDLLELLPAHELGPGMVSMVHTGRAIPGDPEDQLRVRAFHAFHRRHPVPGTRIHLHKVIPTGAGLGGGSSDAAFTLRALNRVYGGPLTHPELHDLATGLGSDVPYFLHDIPMLATGRGEVLSPVAPALAGRWVHLVAPGIHVATGPVYGRATCEEVEVDLARILNEVPVEDWSTRLRNRLQPVVEEAHPLIKELIRRLREQGALFAAMSGSGSSLFGIFGSRPQEMDLPQGGEQWILGPLTT